VASCGSLTLDRSEVGRGLLSIDGITLSHNESQGERSPSRRYLQPEFGVLAVAAAAVLYAFCCVVDTLSGSGANSVIG
jgi:hypothetical protein